MFYTNKNFKNIAVKLSGGADSSLLYYMVCKEYPNANIYPITLVTDQKPFYIDSTNRVIGIVETLLNKTPKEHVFVYGKHTEYTNTLDQGVLDAVEKYNIDIVYNGMTVNTDHNEVRKWVKRNQFRYKIDYNTAMYHIDGRDVERDNFPNYDVIGTMPPSHQVLYNAPWSHKDKTYIAHLYETHDLMETLFPYTITCADYTTETYTNLEEHKHCGYKCFPCLERWHAFGRLD